MNTVLNWGRQASERFTLLNGFTCFIFVIYLHVIIFLITLRAATFIVTTSQYCFVVKFQQKSYSGYKLGLYQNQ